MKKNKIIAGILLVIIFLFFIYIDWKSIFVFIGIVGWILYSVVMYKITFYFFEENKPYNLISGAFYILSFTLFVILISLGVNSAMNIFRPPSNINSLNNYYNISINVSVEGVYDLTKSNILSITIMSIFFAISIRILKILSSKFSSESIKKTYKIFKDFAYASIVLLPIIILYKYTYIPETNIIKYMYPESIILIALSGITCFLIEYLLPFKYKEPIEFDDFEIVKLHKNSIYKKEKKIDFKLFRRLYK
jgi:hypothetical protein